MMGDGFNCGAARDGEFKTFVTLGKDPEAEKKHPLPEIEWVHGYTYGKLAAHPHATFATADGGYLIIGDCTSYHGTGDVGTGEDWPEALKRAILVTKASADGTFEWSYRYGHIGMNYGKFGVELQDNTFVIGGVAGLDDPDVTDHLYVQRRVLLRITADGRPIKDTIFPAYMPESPGRRDGIMSLVAEAGLTEDGGMVVYATGYVGGETGYDSTTHEYNDDPMFLINLGRTFVAMLVFGPVDKEPYGLVATDPSVGWNTVVDAGTQGKTAFRQGMRIIFDRANFQLGVLSTACTSEDNFDAQFGFLAVGIVEGDVRWAKIYPAENANGSHPYALCLSSAGEYVIAGHAIENNWGGLGQKGPTGRACKINATTGDIIWDSRFKQPGRNMNTECYGVCLLPNSNGLLVTCGTGVMPDEHPDDPDEMKVS